MSATTTHSVTVTGLNPQTTQATLEHFFSFCGKIDSVTHNGSDAKVNFVKDSAAKTALMLNGGTLDGSAITVASEGSAPAPVPAAASASEPEHEKAGEEVDQEDKPRSAVMAEYLAHGYVISDQILAKAIAADQEHGISARFLSFFNPLATNIQAAAQPHLERATTKLAEVDEKQGLSYKANAAAIIGSKYYQHALSSPFGVKVHSFYTSTTKQVLDVHEEALRIKERKTAAAADAAPATAAPAVTPAAPSDEKKSSTA